MRQAHAGTAVGGVAGRALALLLFCWDLLSRAPFDMQNIPKNYWTLP